jgi:DNA repair exonuclease SbcCD ATPase subunit
LYEKTIEDCSTSIKKLGEFELQAKAYDFYLKAVNRNGVPYDLIADAIPKVQAEVNFILSQIVDFQILFETDGKSINTYIVYDDENFWPLELTSGMEKFISSLAIRTALVNVSSLPRPNFIAIDEGFGVLDSDNLNSLQMFFEYMRSQFDFILTISHLEALRDIMDFLIEIKKEAGFSNVRV